MKYKITAIIATVFLGISMILYAKNNITAITEKYDGEVFSLSTVKEIVLSLRNNDSENVPSKMKYIELHGLYSEITDKSCIVDIGYDVTKLDNDYLMFTGFENVDTDLEKYSDDLARFAEHLSENDIGLLFVKIPEKVSSDEKKQKLGIINSVNPDIDGFIPLLEKKGVDYIDLEECFKNDSLDLCEMFFKTDHHWLPQTGLYACGKISQKLNDSYGYKTSEDLFDVDNYTVKTYENSFIGSHGRRTGGLFSSSDDFSLVYPKFDTDLTVITKDTGEVKRGSFYDVIFSMEYLSEKPFSYINSYSVYLAGDRAKQVIVNNDPPNDKKIVLIRDSYSAVAAPFLSLLCSEVHLLDLRRCTDISAADYINEVGADTVIVMYSPFMFVEGSSAFDFLSADIKK